MKLRFGDKLRRASKMLDELQMDISNDVRRLRRDALIDHPPPP